MRGVPCLSVPASGRRKSLPMQPVDDWWRGEVRRRVEEKDVTLTEVAAYAKISTATLSGLLTGRYRHSHAVASINEMLGITSRTRAAGTVDETDVGAQLDVALASIEDEQVAKTLREQAEALVKTARAIAAGAKKNN